MEKIRVRYAPSPTGYLHIGNARTALFNYLYAKHNGGSFIIRIEDTDIQRNIEGGEQSQLNNLKWLGLDWDESIDIGGEFGPYNQLERHSQGVYQKYSDMLIDQKKAYRCFCTSEELEAEAQKQKENGIIPRYSGKCRHLTEQEVADNLTANKPFSVRLKVNKNEVFEWNDIVKGDVSFKSDDVSGDFNLLKQNTIPTYNFAVVVDDHLMEITHVLRGEDHISNTPKQMMVYQALGFDYPIFGHMTLIVNEQGKKLSKRDTSIVQFIEEYKDLGFLPKALFNFITLLGWSPKGEEEIFTKSELIELFDEQRLSKSPAKFDKQKLMWINNQYIKELSEKEYLEFVYPFIEYDKSKYTKQYINDVALLYQEQISYAKEINEHISLFISDEFIISEEAKKFIQTEGSIEVVKTFKNKIESLEEFEEQNIKPLIKEVQKELGIKGKPLFMSIRIATTLQMHGPDLTTAIALLGKEKVIATINNFLETVNG